MALAQNNCCDFCVLTLWKKCCTYLLCVLVRKCFLFQLYVRLSQTLTKVDVTHFLFLFVCLVFLESSELNNKEGDARRVSLEAWQKSSGKAYYMNACLYPGLGSVRFDPFHWFSAQEEVNFLQYSHSEYHLDLVHEVNTENKLYECWFFFLSQTFRLNPEPGCYITTLLCLCQSSPCWSGRSSSVCETQSFIQTLATPWP